MGRITEVWNKNPGRNLAKIFNEIFENTKTPTETQENYLQFPNQANLRT